MDNFHFGLVKFVGNHEKLLNLLLDVGNFVFGFGCLWSIYIVRIVFCKIISSKCSLFLCWFRHWSKHLMIHK